MCTKLRNRILSKTTYLILGKQIISSYTLSHIILSKSKIHHGLVYSDIHPRDRQNFLSCQKICKQDVFDLLEQLTDKVPGAKSMFIYLNIMKSAMIAYVENETVLIDRLFHSWLCVFICRFWLAWLDVQSIDHLSQSYFNQLSQLSKMVSVQRSEKRNFQYSPKKRTKESFTISRPCYLSLELNAHSLLYLIVLSIDGQVPSHDLAIELFSSQSCENLFRTARAMSGVASTMVNFTVRDFLQRTSKLNTLQSIKIDHELGEKEAVLHFPKHPKHGKLVNLYQNKCLDDLIELEDIEKIIKESFRSAYELITLVVDRKFLEKNGYDTIDGLAEFTSKRLKIVQSTVKKMRPHHKDGYHPDRLSKDQINQEDMMIDDDDKDEDEDEYVDEDDTDYHYESGEAGEEDDDYIDNEEYQSHEKNAKEQSDEGFDLFEQLVLDSSDGSFRGMRMAESIELSQADSYFKVHRERDGAEMFVHKQTAAWLLMNDKYSLSADRLNRVTQA